MPASPSSVDRPFLAGGVFYAPATDRISQQSFPLFQFDSESTPEDLDSINLDDGETVGTPAEIEEALSNIPEELPILPLRGLVVYPQTAVPLTIGQPRSVRLVDDAMAGEKLIGLVTSKNPELENPGPDDLYAIGTIAIIHRMFRAPDGTIRLLVQGLSRFRLKEFTAVEPYLKARTELAPEQTEEGLETEALARNVRDQFTHIAEMIPSFPRELVASIGAIEDPLQIVYTIANFQRMDLAEAQTLLELDAVTEKLRRLVGILVRESEVLELGQ
jgi:ATP-dependent Lon protease